MLVSDFDYDLPSELIAQEPLADRAASRMLVVDRARGAFEDRAFRDLPAYLGAGDCLVLNNSRVIPSRLLGRREGFPGRAEVLLTKPLTADQRCWEALVHPGRKLRSGERVRVAGDLAVLITGRGERGLRTVYLETPLAPLAAIERYGHVPLPPYIDRPDQPADRERYQTVYATQAGSVAAPTAGLHFTPEVLAACRRSGAEIAELTLHVGLGTFQPLNAEVVEQATLHTELFSIPPDSWEKIERARRRIAVGTTSVRAMESAARMGRCAGETNLFIYPGFEFRRTGALLTNFHLPKSSLLMLVSALAGPELMRAAYRHAVERRYRFFSYGDCMLIV